ncbi:uncharacterized protein LOC110020115 [Phalaenopsis equestris]|uniref:uncharacterized protein LOC110020115 n=1 Tax=Phalaenopsis equestris TaxID=78828 RepID=UPI0009E1EAC8|nr:uncharacterized protein LOC110020115 [Phalaenopsis equestris]
MAAEVGGWEEVQTADAYEKQDDASNTSDENDKTTASPANIAEAKEAIKKKIDEKVIHIAEKSNNIDAIDRDNNNKGENKIEGDDKKKRNDKTMIEGNEKVIDDNDLALISGYKSGDSKSDSESKSDSDSKSDSNSKSDDSKSDSSSKSSSANKYDSDSKPSPDSKSTPDTSSSKKKKPGSAGERRKNPNRKKKRGLKLTT